MSLINNILNNGKGSNVNYPDIDNTNLQKSSVLDPLKKSANLNPTQYLNYLEESKIKPNPLSKRTFTINQNLNGHSPLYKICVFTNTIENLVDTLTEEVFSDLKITNISDAEITNVDIQNVKATLQLNSKKFEEIFKYLYLYGEIFVVPTYSTADVSFTLFLPFQYVELNNQTWIIDVDGKKLIPTEGFVISYKSNFYKNLETVLSYDLINSAIVKETALNQSKLFTDSKMFKKNAVYDETINLVDVPKSPLAGVENSKTKYIDVFSGKNTLTDLIGAKREMELNLTKSFRLSKKALGLDSSGVDFASSLPYENDKTAKTINGIREDLAITFSNFVTNLTGVKVIFDFGTYELSSLEAIVDTNQKALSSNQMSIRRGVARNLDANIDDINVSRETLTIKIEKNITLTFEEETEAIKLGLMAPMQTVEEIEVDETEEVVEL